MVMKINKSLCGLVQTLIYWYNHMKGAFEASVFKPIPQDPCIFYGIGMIELIYVDDVFFFGPDQDKIDEVINELDDSDLLLNIEDYVYDLLGVKVKTNKHPCKVTLTHGGFTKKVMKTVVSLDSNKKITPEEKMPLGIDSDRTLFDEPWEYASVVGM